MNKRPKLSIDKHYGKSSKDVLTSVGMDVNQDVNPMNLQILCSVNLEVGTPSKLLTVLLETRSSNMWVLAQTIPTAKMLHNTAQIRVIFHCAAYPCKRPLELYIAQCMALLTIATQALLAPTTRHFLSNMRTALCTRSVCTGHCSNQFTQRPKCLAGCRTPV